jgi:hypothetical protein
MGICKKKKDERIGEGDDKMIGVRGSKMDGRGEMGGWVGGKRDMGQGR